MYEKKLCTYPRTDSRYLTADMEGTVPALTAAAAKICGVAVQDTVLAAQVCNSAKVTDHHAIVPTEGAGRTDVEALPAGEREILRLVARGLLCATGSSYRYQETAITLSCGGNQFSVKGKAITDPGWKVIVLRKADPQKKAFCRRTDRRNDTPCHRCHHQGGQNYRPEALHRGHAALCDGNGWRKGYAGGCGAQGHRHTGHPRRYLRKAGVHRLCRCKSRKRPPTSSPRRSAFP